MKVLGIDPSLTATALAGWPDRTLLVPSAAGGGLARLRGLTRFVCQAAEGDWDAVCIEGPAPSERHGHVHERGGLWWFLVDGLDILGLPILVCGPSTLKKFATGRGNANKDQMMLAAARRFDWFAGGNDEADALMLSAAGCEFLGKPMVTMPASHTDKLASAMTWATERRLRV